MVRTLPWVSTAKDDRSNVASSNPVESPTRNPNPKRITVKAKVRDHSTASNAQSAPTTSKRPRLDLCVPSEKQHHEYSDIEVDSPPPSAQPTLLFQRPLSSSPIRDSHSPSSSQDLDGELERETMRPSDEMYIMVEDELLSTAQHFTRSLHKADYRRLKQTVFANPSAGVHQAARRSALNVGGIPGRQDQKASSKARDVTGEAAEDGHNSKVVAEDGHDIKVVGKEYRENSKIKDKSLARLMRGHGVSRARDLKMEISKDELHAKGRTRASAGYGAQVHRPPSPFATGGVDGKSKVTHPKNKPYVYDLSTTSISKLELDGHSYEQKRQDTVQTPEKTSHYDDRLTTTSPSQSREFRASVRRRRHLEESKAAAKPTVEEIPTFLF